MSNLVCSIGPQQSGERLRCSSLRRQRQEAFNRRCGLGGLHTIGFDSSHEIIEHRSVISGGLLHAHTSDSGVKSSKSRMDHRGVGPAATLLRHAPTPMLVETAHSVLYKILFTGRLPRKKTCGAEKRFWQETDHCTEQSGYASL